MLKLFIVVAVVSFLVVVGVVFVKGKLLSPAPLAVNVMEKKVAKTKGDLLGQTKEAVKEAIDKTANDLNKAVDKLIPAGKEKEPAVIVRVANVPTNNASPEREELTIDFARRESAKLRLVKGVSQIFRFANFPPGFCFFVGGSQFAIESGGPLAVEFTQSGTFTIKTDFCKGEDKEWGEVIVE